MQLYIRVFARTMLPDELCMRYATRFIQFKLIYLSSSFQTKQNNIQIIAILLGSQRVWLQYLYCHGYGNYVGESVGRCLVENNRHRRLLLKQRKENSMAFYHNRQFVKELLALRKEPDTYVWLWPEKVLFSVRRSFASSDEETCLRC